MMGEKKRVLLVNGSPHKQGNTKRALEIVASELDDALVQTDWFELGVRPVHGCVACGHCERVGRCAFTDDGCNELIEKMLVADTVILGSPVYFAGPNGALCSLLDRAFFAVAENGQQLRGKLGAAVVSVWREGGSAAIDRLNKYFTFAQMPIVSSDYWNVQLGPRDAYGEQVLRTLGRNLGELLGCLA